MFFLGSTIEYFSFSFSLTIFFLQPLKLILALKSKLSYRLMGYIPTLMEILWDWHMFHIKLL